MTGWIQGYLNREPWTFEPLTPWPLESLDPLLQQIGEESLIYWRMDMKREEELAVKATKEIVVKFIEVGRLSVNSFDGVWKQIYKTIRDSLSPKKPEKPKDQ